MDQKAKPVKIPLRVEDAVRGLLQVKPDDRPKKSDSKRAKRVQKPKKG